MRPQIPVEHNIQNALKPKRGGHLRKQPRVKLIEAVQFRDERIYSGLSREDAAELLGVSLRTIGHWETGRVRVGYAAFKLLRVYRHGDIADPAWASYKISRGKLRTPEGHEFGPGDVSWLCLLVRRAALAAEITRQRDALRVQLTAIEAAVGAAERSLGLVYYSTSDTPVLKPLRQQGFGVAPLVVNGANVVPQWHHEQAHGKVEPSSPAGHQGGTPELRGQPGDLSQCGRYSGDPEFPAVRLEQGPVLKSGRVWDGKLQGRPDQGSGCDASQASRMPSASQDWAKRDVPLRQRPESEGLPSRVDVAGESA